MTLETNESVVESRFLTCPKFEGVTQNSIKVVNDEYGGAHTYFIDNVYGRDANGDWITEGIDGISSYQNIQFFERKTGDNGEQITKEGIVDIQLLDVLIDRLRKLNGKFQSPDNDECLSALHTARSFLQKRTFERLNREALGKLKT